MKRIVTGLGALFALVAVVVGLPVGLVAVFGNPIPVLAELFTQPAAFFDTLAGMVTTPDYTGEVLFTAVVPTIAWLLWAFFVVSLLLELPSQLGKMAPVRLPLRAAGMQLAAGALLAAVIVLFSSTGISGSASANATAAAPLEPRAAAMEVVDQTEPELQVETQTVVVEQEHVVQPGDTMWDVAEQQYGDGQQYDQIFTATAGDAQPVGAPISDPNLILPGQILYVPTEVTVEVPVEQAPVQDADTVDAAVIDEQAPVVDAASATSKGTLSGSSETATAPDQSAPTEDQESVASDSTTIVDDVDQVHDDIDETEQADWAPLWTAGGAGGILIGGLLATIGIRRVRQRSRTLPGQRPAQVAETVSPVEMSLRYVEAPSTIAAIDQATRFIAADAQERGVPLPDLFAARIDAAGLTLFFATPAQLPEPFQLDAEDSTAWLLPLDRVPHVTTLTSAPYPALVTLGRDEQGGQLLVNLEFLGALHYDGDRQLARTAMMVLASELCTTAWGDAMRVTLVGFGHGLPHLLETDRLNVADDIQDLIAQLRSVADDHQAAVEAAGLESVAAARSADPDADFAPEIVLLGEAPDAETRDELAQLLERLPHIGMAVISSDRISGEWSLEIDSADAAILQPLGLPIQPQLISDEEYEAIVALMAATDAPAEPGPEWAQSLQEEPAPNAPATVPSTPAEEVVEVALPEHAGPYLSIFGAVELQGAAGQTSGNATSISRWTEVIAYVAFHPGVRGERLHQDFWPGESGGAPGTTAYQKRAALISRARRWISPQYFPTPTRGQGLHLDGVRTQWDDWQWLVGEDISQASTSRLVTALSMIKGKPFATERDHTFGWTDVTGGIRAQIIGSIVDVAHEVAVRGWEAHDPHLMRIAAATGLLVSPLQQSFWRASMRAEHLAGNADGVERIITHLHLELEAYSTDHDQLEPEDQTLQLIDTLRGKQPAALSS